MIELTKPDFSTWTDEQISLCWTTIVDNFTPAELAQITDKNAPAFTLSERLQVGRNLFDHIRAVRPRLANRIAVLQRD